MSVTIFDVAASAGVSKATVSRAFTNPTAVNHDTLKRIQKAAEVLNYRPNAVARAMITKRTGNFAFITYGAQAPVITNPFYGPILESVVKSAGDTGHSMFIVSDEELRIDSGELILQKQVDGIIFASQPNLDMVASARRSGIPLVFINHVIENAYCLVCDDKGGTIRAVEHLAELGHTRIGLLSGLFTDFIRNRRHQAYCEAMASHGLTVSPEWLAEVHPGIRQAHDGALRLLCKPNRPTALLCTNDAIAAGAIKAALHLGLRVPEDLSVIGYDNSAFCTVCEPDLTSVDVGKEEMGALAVKCLMAQINGKIWEDEITVLPAELIVRASTARL